MKKFFCKKEHLNVFKVFNLTGKVIDAKLLTIEEDIMVEVTYIGESVNINLKYKVIKYEATFSKDYFWEHYISLSEFREKRIDKILGI